MTWVYEFQHDRSASRGALERALKLARPEGIARPFLAEGRELTRLLQGAASGGRVADYARHLVEIIEPEGQTPDPKFMPEEILLVEPLTEREIEVLEQMAEGLTNQEIADRLFVTLNTVKVHSRNIYSKLDVHNRTQAVARGRKLGLMR